MSGAKTEEPTPRRLRRAREEGDSGASAFAPQAVGLVVAVLLVPASIAAVAERVAARLREAIAIAAEREPSVRFDAWRAARDVVALSAPVLIAVAVAVGAAQLAQTGGFVATRRLGARLFRLNPFEGVRALVSRAKGLAIARAIAGGALVAWLVAHALRAHAVDLARVSGRLAYVGPLGASLAKTVAWGAATAGLALAGIDVVVVRLEWRRRLRMSKDDVMREQKESEGDPRVKQARGQAHEEMLAAAAITSVKRATVVVSAEHIACALGYDEERADEAPVVVATGEGERAAQIVRAARAFGVPVVMRDARLARALVELEVGGAVGEALYESVAAIVRDAIGPSERPKDDT